jgi:hypothetical protein
LELFLYDLYFSYIGKYSGGASNAYALGLYKDLMISSVFLSYDNTGSLYHEG